MRRKENNLWNVLRIVIILLLFGIAAGTGNAATQAGTIADIGTNVTINSTSATGYSDALNTTPGASITVSFSKTNAISKYLDYSASLQWCSINGSGTPSGIINSNGTFTLTAVFRRISCSITVNNAEID